MFKREHVLHVYKAEEKVLELEKLKDRYHKLPVFVEDTFKTILNAEEAEVARGIHISFFSDIKISTSRLRGAFIMPYYHCVFNVYAVSNAPYLI